MLKRRYLSCCAAVAILADCFVVHAQVISDDLRKVLPFDPPSRNEMKASNRKVFAHYFTPFPLSIDNKPADRDIYALAYLNPGGEGGKHASYGGYLRQRPLPVGVRAETDWEKRNMQDEIRMAVDAGLDGFVVDILTFSNPWWNRTVMLMDVATSVDPDFKIMLMPDMNAEFKGEKEPVKLTRAIQTLGQYPSAFRWNDGRLVVCPFLTEARSPEWWKSWLDSMENAGTPIAFMPMVLGQGNWKDGFGAIGFGASEWGPRAPVNVAKMRQTPSTYHKQNLIWMAPVAPQDMRAKDAMYWETRNTATFRIMWENAIAGGADWVQLITWNDYSEATEIAPSTGTQYLFYDLTAYYATWFKLGRQPEIVRDVLYYSHRLHSTEAKPDPAKQKREFSRREENEPASNQVELLAFLKEPGTIQIEIAGKISTCEAPAGITAFTAPLAEGRPRFRLVRQKQSVIDFESNWEISNQIVYQNLLYCGGSSSRQPIPVK